LNDDTDSEIDNIIGGLSIDEPGNWFKELFDNFVDDDTDDASEEEPLHNESCTSFLIN
jgi:hypothetical protein